MRDRLDEIAIYMIGAMMCMELSLTKVFCKVIPVFNLSYNSPLVCVIYVLIIISVYAIVIVPRIMDGGIRSLFDEYSFLIVELVVMALSLISTDIITIAKGQLRLTNILTHNLDYMYVFLALPVVVLLCEGKWKWDDFANTVITLTMLSMLIRLIVSVLYGFTGIEIECISRESAAEGWIRNDRLRVTPPCLIMLTGPLSIYMFTRVESIKKKLIYAGTLAMTVFYVYYVWQSRIAIVFVAAGVAVMVLFRIMSRRQTAIRWGITAAGIVAFLALGGLNRILGIFSTSSEAMYAGENKGHYFAYELFWSRFVVAPYGDGFTENMSALSNDGRYMWLCDAGIMYSLLPMGIMIACMFLLMFSRGLFVYMKGFGRNKMAVLSLALTAVLVVCELSMDCFFTPTAFSVPFYLAIVEYANSLREAG